MYINQYNTYPLVAPIIYVIIYGIQYYGIILLYLSYTRYSKFETVNLKK